MKFRTSLRYRVTLSFSLLGLVVSTALAGGLYMLTVLIEERLIAETLSAELEDYIGRYSEDPETSPPTSTVISTYVLSPGSKEVPVELQGLAPGLQQVHLTGVDYYAEVRMFADRHFVVLYDSRQIVQRERQFILFLCLAVLIMTCLSAFLGYWLAGKVISPVGDLAARVAGLQAEEYREPLARDFPRDEVGSLAQEFDAYLQRLSDFIEREQSFTADVSHELRTPLTVIEGATDVMLENQAIDDAMRSRLQRIARSAREMSELVNALLMLAREQNKETVEAGCTVSEVLRQVVDGHQHLLLHRPVELKVDIKAQIILPVECTLLRIVLANLVRNAVNFTNHGQINICLDERGVSVRDTGIGISKDEIQHIFDRFYKGSSGGEGIGLSLVKRICHLYNWEIQVDSEVEGGTALRMIFKHSSTNRTTS